MLLAIWIVASLLVAFMGRRRLLGFWGFLLVSLFASPLLVGLILLFTSPRPPQDPV